VSRGRLVFSTLVAAAAAGAALLLVAGGSAGTNDFVFNVAAGPPTVSVGATGFIVAKFQPAKGSGAASHTVITFTFPAASVTGPPMPDTDSSPDCGAAVGGGTRPWVISCNVGTVTPGKLVKRFVTFKARSATDDGDIGASVGFDNGAKKAQGGGVVSGLSASAGVTIVAGSNAAGRCDPGGGVVSAETDVQQTSLSFHTTSEPVPCSWGTVSVIESNRDGSGHAPKISSVGGVLYDTPSQITLTFDGSPVAHLQENENFNPTNPNTGWTNVLDCADGPTLPDGADACVVGYVLVGDGREGQHCDGDGDGDDAGCATKYTLLYRGSNAGPAGGADPWFN
jgi:hypothetical protein